MRETIYANLLYARHLRKQPAYAVQQSTVSSLSGNWERARFFSLFAHQLATKITYLEMPR